MKATLEPVAFVLRFHDEADGELATVTTYRAACTVTVDDAKVACIRGLAMDQFGREAWDAAAAALRAVGVEQMMFSRRNHGRTRIVVKRIAG